MQGPSRQELIRRQRRSGFVGRYGELSIFKEVLKRPPEETTQFLFHVRGPGGVGKSTLLRQMESAAREAQAITAYIDESVTDAIEAMETISGQMAQQGLSLKNFDKRLATYRQRRHEADATTAAAVQPAGDAPVLTGQGPAGPNPSPSSIVASQLGLVGLGMIPGVGAFVGAVDPQQVAAGASQIKAVLSSRFSNHDDVKLVLSPLQELTPIFLKDLSEVAQRRTWLVLSFDTYERVGPLLNTWLRDILVSNRYGEIPANILVVLAGQSHLEESCWGDFRDLITELPLDVFTEVEARQLLSTKGVTDERVIEVILQLSRRLPVLVSTLAEGHPSSVAEVGDPSDTAVERFLKWETDPARRAAALACALPQEFDEDVYRAAVEDEAADLFEWLKSMPFLHYRSGHCRYHEVVRAAMLSLQRQQSPSRWHRQQTRLAESFEERRIQLEQTHSSQSKNWWDEEAWRKFRTQEIYHRLCADPHAAFPTALRLLVDAYKSSTNAARRWAQTMVQAGQDSGAPSISDWGQQFLDALESAPQTRITFFSLLLARSELDTEGRSLVHILRGRHLRKSEDYRQAISEYTAAITLNPASQVAYRERGQTHHMADQSDDALSDYDRALELDPDSTRTLISRGLVYMGKHQFDDAINDYDRAIAIDHTNGAAHTSRGLVYHFMEKFDDALNDFDRALELDPENSWAYTRRGDTYSVINRQDDALCDYSRAIDIDPKSVYSLIGRGLIYSTSERFAEALKDFTRVIELQPDHAAAHAARGLTYDAVGRNDDALADYNRAIQIEPNNANFLTSRGLAYQFKRQFDDALNDYNHAVELDSSNAWTHVNRGLVHHYMQQFTEALSDFNRAIELSPSDAWAYANRGDTNHSLLQYDDALADYQRALELRSDDTRVLLGRGLTYYSKEMYDEALADYDRAHEITPDDARILTCRGMVYRAMTLYDEAFADHNRAIELAPESGWAYANRGAVLESMRRYDDALADYDRAVELEPENAWSRTGRAQAYRELCRYDDALADLNHALQVEPDDVRLITSRGLICRLLSQYENAIADFSRAIELDPQNGWSYTNRGLLYRLLGRHDDALIDHDRAVVLSPRSGWAHYERSVVHYALLRGDRKKQLAQTIKVISSGSDGPAKKGNLFLTACLMMRWQKAEMHFSEFMSTSHSPGEENEFLLAIGSLEKAVPARQERLTIFRQRLET